MADIKIYGKLVNATESGKIANYSQIDGAPDITEVEANPTGSGTENLTRLKVGDIIYNVPQGGGGGSGVDIEQTTGQSTTAVMSQKAVTDELNNKVDKITGKGLVYVNGGDGKPTSIKFDQVSASSGTIV